jgi:hypothetical protein
MSDVHATDDHRTADHGAAAAFDEPHGAGDHGGDHGHDDHGHVDEPLGPIDVAAWGVGILGVAVGLATAFCFALATGPLIV